MTAPANPTAVDVEAEDVGVIMAGIGAAAKNAAGPMAMATTDAKNKALTVAAETILASAPDILAANAIDVEAAEAKGLSGALVDRLVLNQDRIDGMAQGLTEIAALDDPVGATIAEWDRPNGFAHFPGAGALGGDRSHLRIPPQRHRGRRGIVPKVRQPGNSARRL